MQNSLLHSTAVFRLDPSEIILADPDYKVTNLYGLRWNAPNETVYPATFILNKKRGINFEKISHSHGDRLSAQDALAHLLVIQ
jgi:thioredoxin-dependent peroxiredoxin